MGEAIADLDGGVIRDKIHVSGLPITGLVSTARHRVGLRSRPGAIAGTGGMWRATFVNMSRCLPL